MASSTHHADVKSFDIAWWLRKRGKPIRPKLSKDQLAELEECFHSIDDDETGSIDTHELVEAFRVLGLHLTADDARQIIARVDRDNSGTIEFTEFIDIMTQTLAAEAVQAHEAGGTKRGILSQGIKTQQFKTYKEMIGLDEDASLGDLHGQSKGSRPSNAAAALSRDRALSFPMIAMALRRKKVIDGLASEYEETIRKLNERRVVMEEEKLRKRHHKQEVVQSGVATVTTAMRRLNREKRAGFLDNFEKIMNSKLPDSRPDTSTAAETKKRVAAMTAVAPLLPTQSLASTRNGLMRHRSRGTDSAARTSDAEELYNNNNTSDARGRRSFGMSEAGGGHSSTSPSMSPSRAQTPRKSGGGVGFGVSFQQFDDASSDDESFSDEEDRRGRRDSAATMTDATTTWTGIRCRPMPQTRTLLPTTSTLLAQAAAAARTSTSRPTTARPMTARPTTAKSLSGGVSRPTTARSSAGRTSGPGVDLTDAADWARSAAASDTILHDAQNAPYTSNLAPPTISINHPAAHVTPITISIRRPAASMRPRSAAIAPPRLKSTGVRRIHDATRMSTATTIHAMTTQRVGKSDRWSAGEDGAAMNDASIRPVTAPRMSSMDLGAGGGGGGGGGWHSTSTALVDALQPRFSEQPGMTPRLSTSWSALGQRPTTTGTAMFAARASRGESRAATASGRPSASPTLSLSVHGTSARPASRATTNRQRLDAEHSHPVRHEMDLRRVAAQCVLEEAGRLEDGATSASVSLAPSRVQTALSRATSVGRR